jgi:hypothetical protein
MVSKIPLYSPYLFFPSFHLVSSYDSSLFESPEARSEHHTILLSVGLRTSYFILRILIRTHPIIGTTTHATTDSVNYLILTPLAIAPTTRAIAHFPSCLIITPLAIAIPNHTTLKFAS